MHLAVKLPDDLRKRVCSFPFLQALVKGLRAEIEAKNEELPEEERDSLVVHLIAIKAEIEVLNLLPFTAFYHELEAEDLKSVFTAHRGVKNLKIERLDAYVSTTESFVDASIGKSLGVATRAGFGIGKNSLFFNKKAPLLKGRHYCEQYHELLKLLLEEVPEEPQKGYSRELEPVWEDWRENPYYLVNLSAKEGEIEKHWKELFAFAEGERFVLMCHELEEDMRREALAEFAKELPGTNTYEIADCLDLIEFSKLASYAASFITEDSSLMQVAAYCGGHVHFLGERENMQVSGPVYFLGEVRYFNLKEPIYLEGGQTAYHKVYDEILKFMDAKSKANEKEQK